MEPYYPWLVSYLRSWTLIDRNESMSILSTTLMQRNSICPPRLYISTHLINASYFRYYAVCLPLRAGLIWTKNKAGMVCLVSWMLSIVLTSPMLAIANYIDDPNNPKCSTNVDPPWTKAFFLSIISLFFWLPLFVLVLLYAIIASHLTANVNVPRHAGSTSTNHGQLTGRHARLKCFLAPDWSVCTSPGFWLVEIDNL